MSVGFCTVPTRPALASTQLCLASFFRLERHCVCLCPSRPQLKQRMGSFALSRIRKHCFDVCPDFSQNWHVTFAEFSLVTHTCGSLVSFFMVAIISVSRSFMDCCSSMQAFTSLEIELAGELPIIKASCESRAHLVASSNDFASFWTIGIRRCGGSPRTNAVVFSWSLL